MNDIETQQLLSQEITNLLFNPKINLFSTLFYSQQLDPIKYQIIIYFLKNKITDFKKQFGYGFCTALLNELTSFFFQEISENEQKALVMQIPLKEQIKKLMHLKDVFDKSANDVEELLLLQVVQRVSKLICVQFNGNGYNFGNNFKKLLMHRNTYGTLLCLRIVFCLIWHCRRLCQTQM
jgi:hypothetical protein